jgi:hypothetical protein
MTRRTESIRIHPDLYAAIDARARRDRAEAMHTLFVGLLARFKSRTPRVGAPAGSLLGRLHWG